MCEAHACWTDVRAVLAHIFELLCLRLFAFQHASRQLCSLAADKDAWAAHPKWNCVKLMPAGRPSTRAVLALCASSGRASVEVLAVCTAGKSSLHAACISCSCVCELRARVQVTARCCVGAAHLHLLPARNAQAATKLQQLFRCTPPHSQLACAPGISQGAVQPYRVSQSRLCSVWQLRMLRRGAVGPHCLCGGLCARVALCLQVTSGHSCTSDLCSLFAESVYTQLVLAQVQTSKRDAVLELEQDHSDAQGSRSPLRKL